MKRLFVIAALALGVAAPAHARGHHHVTPASYCGLADSYVNVSGNCVHRPMRANSQPAGATARCLDGTYSFSQHHRGTCSHHGGVASWL